MDETDFATALASRSGAIASKAKGRKQHTSPPNADLPQGQVVTSVTVGTAIRTLTTQGAGVSAVHVEQVTG